MDLPALMMAYYMLPVTKFLQPSVGSVPLIFRDVKVELISGCQTVAGNKDAGDSSIATTVPAPQYCQTPRSSLVLPLN
jgi:hypothetical protein